MSARNSILRVLAYFDLFDYPLSREEVLFFLDQEIGEAELDAALAALADEQYLFKLDQFYSLRNIPSLVERRIKGNKHAQELILIARRISRRLFQFPYVRGIGISGSLSKNYADEHADIDYFVITRANRLWIARTCMHLFKKWSFLTGRQHWYCMNYYVDEEALEIQEKNIFTAIELITLIPVCGNGGLVHFFDANDWATALLPHYRGRGRVAPGEWRPSFLKKAVEWLFDNKAGDWLDDILRRLTARRWQHKESRGLRNAKGFRMSLRTGKHFSRPNPDMLQKRILTVYTDKLKELGSKCGMNLHADIPTAAAGPLRIDPIPSFEN
jgi:hypothetical protein